MPKPVPSKATDDAAAPCSRAPTAAPPSAGSRLVSYEGTPIVSTGCFGTIGLVGCTQAGIYSACCDGGGECDLRFRYGPGSSTTLTVTVAPNCSGTADTQWVFKLLCPQ